MRTILTKYHTEHRLLPHNLKPKDAALFSHELKVSFEPSHYVSFEDVTILGGSFFQSHRLFKYQSSPSTGAPARSKKSTIKDLLSLRFRQVHLNECLWIHDEWSTNYFHWMTDCLQKLQAWIDSGNLCRKVYLPPALASIEYVTSSLNCLGFEPIVSRNTKVDRLIYIENVASSGNYRHSLLLPVINTLKSCLSDSKNTSEPSQYLYISRRDASRRVLTNDAEVTSFLARHQFQVLTLSSLTLGQQISALKDSTILISLHGAGLTNMIWMRRGSHVIEIRKRSDCKNNCYFSLASLLQHNYYYILADDESESDDILDSALKVDISSLTEILEQLGIASHTN